MNKNQNGQLQIRVVGNYSLQNKTRTSKVGALLRLKKHKTFFGKKLENFFFRKMSHSAEKCKKPFYIFRHHNLLCRGAKLPSVSFFYRFCHFITPVSMWIFYRGPVRGFEPGMELENFVSENIPVLGRFAFVTA